MGKLAILIGMKMINAVKLLEYNQELRGRYLDTLSELPWEDVVKDRGASFPSLRDIYLHCVVCVDGIVNNILQGDPSFPRINYDDYDSIEKIREYVEQVEPKANEYLSKVTSEELSRTIERKQRDGSTTLATVEDYLIHLFQEETHHLGELIALLWQIDVRPPHMGWIQYINQ
jgi:uncharacterized damage-inducible protein DinB